MTTAEAITVDDHSTPPQRPTAPGRLETAALIAGSALGGILACGLVLIWIDHALTHVQATIITWITVALAAMTFLFIAIVRSVARHVAQRAVQAVQVSIELAKQSLQTEIRASRWEIAQARTESREKRAELSAKIAALDEQIAALERPTQRPAPRRLRSSRLRSSRLRAVGDQLADEFSEFLRGQGEDDANGDDR